MQVVLPSNPAPDADESDKVIWQEEYKDKREKLRRLEENKSKSFALALRQCSLNVVVNLHSGKIRETRDILGLLKLIQAISCKFESSNKPHWAPAMEKRLKFFIQTKSCSNEK